MKISLNWLTDYVDVTMPAAELASLLMHIGLAVESIEETDSDIVLDVEVTSNRPDCLGHIGVAREIAAATGQPLRLPNLANVPVVGELAGLTSVEVLDSEFCPRYTARLLRGVKIQPSPTWMVERLEAVGLRGINNVVDATNYVMMEYSQPLHSFDYDKLVGRRIVVRRARDGERITAIDGTRHELRDWMGIIADAERPVAVAGVMGGLDTEVTDSTVNVLMEAAQFDPLMIRRASRELSLMSDSSYRFERAVDPVALERASLRACQLILQSGGGELLGGVVDVWAKPYQAPKVSLRPARCNRILGIDVPRPKQLAVLTSLGLQPREEGEVITCTVPPYRPDLTREIDLIEEVARIHGYDNIPAGGQVTHEVTSPSRLDLARKAVGEVLNAAGFYEAVTFTFIDREEAELFGWHNSLAVEKRIRKTNNVLREGLLPSLLRARKTNQDGGAERVDLFELSAVFPPKGEGLPAEHTQLALLSDGSLQDVRAALEAVVRRFDPSAALEVRAADVAGFAPGSAAELTLAGQPFGLMGVLADAVRDRYGLVNAPTGAMVRFDVLMSLGQAVRRYQPMPRFPAIRRDLSVVVDEGLIWQELSQTVASSAGPLCVAVDYVGAYRGKQIGSGKKSLTMHLTYRHLDRTLRHEEVDESVNAVIARLKASYNVELRA